jgi:Flp pilus assembly protein TadD
MLSALTGPEISVTDSERVELRIEQELADLLGAMPRPVELLRGFERIIHPIDDWLSPFAVSIFTGLSPSITGPWSIISVENWSERTEKVTQHLATGCADHYGRLFPNEPLGQMAEFYLNGLIFPITEYNEVTLTKAAKEAGSYLKGLGVDEERLRALAANLVRLGNDRIAHYGFILGAVLGERFSIKEVLFRGSTLGAYGAMLRPAFSTLRAIIAESDDWVVRSEYLPHDTDALLNEMRHGILPWLQMDLEMILQQLKLPRFRELLLALISFEHAPAVRIIDEIIEEDPKKIPLRVQRAFLDVINGDFDAAKAATKKLLSEPEGEVAAAVQLLAGNLALRDGRTEEAERHFRKAANLGVSSPETRTEALHNLGLIAETLGDLVLAQERYLESSGLNPCHAGNLIAQRRIAERLGKVDEAERRKSILCEMLPFDREVFGL